MQAWRQTKGRGGLQDQSRKVPVGKPNLGNCLECRFFVKIEGVGQLFDKLVLLNLSEFVLRWPCGNRVWWRPLALLGSPMIPFLQYAFGFSEAATS